MIRKGPAPTAGRARLPRMRGDDPGVECLHEGAQWFAPHARG